MTVTLRPITANATMVGLFASLRFRPTGEMEDGELLVRLRVADR
jgi:hypothetical protein